MAPVTRSQAHQQEHGNSHIEQMQDPLTQIGPDIMLMHVFGILEPEQLARCMLVCKDWQGLAELDVLWGKHCERLWEGKFEVPTCARKVSTKLKAYSLSLEDAQRTQISEEELCSFLWGFHFKPVAGEHWMLLDPYWHGQGKMMQRVFNSDQTMSSIPIGEPNWLADYECTWRLTKSKERRPGCFVKVNHWPSLEMQRTASWGWRMENIWVVYHSLCSNRPPA